MKEIKSSKHMYINKGLFGANVFLGWRSSNEVRKEHLFL